MSQTLNQIIKKQHYFVYFAIQLDRSGRSPKYNLKIGHSISPFKRIYSFSDYEHECQLVHTIEVDSKKLALSLEKSFIRILKDLGEKTYSDTREWFPLTDTIKNQLSQWEIANEMV